jgi:quercetin dioxygenase-like cupin family protein
MTDTSELVGNVVDVAGLIDYQPGSIVSREVVKRGVGTVTVFAFDSGQGLSEHTAPFDALVFVLDGTAEITIDGSPHGVGPGEMLIMPANRPHALNAREKFKMMLVMIRDAAK